MASDISRTYSTSDDHRIDEESLKDADVAVQIDVIETWFREHYEDPAERTPYESAEGGFIWIWGGPYDAREEIDSEFSGVVAEEVIDQVVERLQTECHEWAPTPDPSDYDQLIEDIVENSEYYDNFFDAVTDIEGLLKTNVAKSVSPVFHRALYVNVITAMEAYLSDAFINTVVNSGQLTRRFVETTPEFRSQKISLADVFTEFDGIQKRVRAYLIDVVWHHIDRIKPMYRDTLGVEFPRDLSKIGPAIRKRHDLVHRNGRTKDGQEILIEREDVVQLIGDVREFVQNIDGQVTKVKAAASLESDQPLEF